MSFDVPARLAEGRTAVANTQVYVDGCRAVGYQNVDLTARGGQVDEWYATEDGLDLAALDADCATLRAAAGAAAEALRIERAGMAVMASAWSGDSGGLASEFVERHCSAGATMVDAMRSAAETCTALRDRLWVLINGKVDTATAIDNRRAGERAGWLAAAHSVTTGASGRDDAVETVKQRIVPYVDSDIRADWVDAMRSAMTSVDAAYDEAARALGAHESVDFAVPTQFGPPIPPPPAPHSGVARPGPAAMTTPASAPAPAVAPAVAPAAPAPDSPTPPPIPEVPAAQPIPAAPPMTTPGADLASPFGAGPGAGPPTAGGGGLGSGGGLSTLVSEILDALGGLFDDPTADPTADPTDGPVDETIDNPADSPDDADAAVQFPDGRSPAAEAADGPESPVPQPGPTEPDSATPPVDGIEAEPVESEPEEPPVMPPPAAPEPDPRTPCAIAADELPQVGQ